MLSASHVAYILAQVMHIKSGYSQHEDLQPKDITFAGEDMQEKSRWKQSRD